MQMQQGIGGDEHEVEGAAQIEGPHVALHPFHRYTALVRLTLSLSQHVRREVQADARMPVGRDGDQLVPGAAPEFQYAPALPVGAYPVEVDCGLATRGH